MFLKKKQQPWNNNKFYKNFKKVICILKMKSMITEIINISIKLCAKDSIHHLESLAQIQES